jgi:putative ABC transport system ATP-binding protein
MTAAFPLIRLVDVGKMFATASLQTHALHGVHLDIEPGEFVAISGASGSGKTTLLSVLGLLDVPDSGRYFLDGKPTATLGPDARAALRNRMIGFVFQSFNLIGDLNVEENVALPLHYRGVPAGQRSVLVAEALEQVGMGHRRQHYPSQLSGGQQQRVAVARAVVGKPALLLADEPTGNLDSANGAAVMNLLSGLHAQGTTVCMVTHDQAYTRFASRTVQLFDGRVVAERAARAQGGA